MAFSSMGGIHCTFLLLGFLLVQSCCADPLAKEVIRAMDHVISNHIEWNNWNAWHGIMQQYFVTDMTYDTNYSPDTTMGNNTGILQWWDAEHTPYNEAFYNTTFTQMIFAAENQTATTTSYSNAIWKGPFCTIAPTNKSVTMRIFDFYQLSGKKIVYNWMLIDTVDLMLQAGYRVLPKPPLRESFVRPPNAMEGIPAPISLLTNPEETEQAREIVSQVIFADLEEDIGNSAASSAWADDMTWYGPVGFGMATNKEEYESNFIAPIRRAFTDRHVALDLIVCEGTYCGAHGYLHGKHTGEFLGEPASNEYISLRFGLHWRVDVRNQIIPEGYAIFDLPAFFNQIGIDLYERVGDERFSVSLAETSDKYMVRPVNSETSKSSGASGSESNNRSFSLLSSFYIITPLCLIFIFVMRRRRLQSAITERKRLTEAVAENNQL